MRRAASPTASMVGATRAVSTFMRGLLSVSENELRDRFVHEVWLLAHEEVAGLFDLAEGEVGEEIRELVAPGEGEYGVAVAPEDEGGGVDLRVAFELPASAEGGAVAVEAAPDGARLRERFDVFGDLFVGPEVLVER